MKYRWIRKTQKSTFKESFARQTFYTRYLLLF